MQAADIFYLGADICQLGTDQRKINVLAREIAHELGYKKPVAVHHHMLMGLLPPDSTGNESALERSIKLKMSKSVPDSAIFVTDSEEEVSHKINKAYCPESIKENNPILEYCRYIIFPTVKSMEIERSKKHGGNLSYGSYSRLEEAFVSRHLHPLDLKNSVTKYLNQLLDPIRKHFETDQTARGLKESVDAMTVTR
jgi:tyrosyl-tRNA synthetase